MRTLVIEWRHLDIEGETCARCYDTGENLAAEIKRLNRALEHRAIRVVLLETLLPESQTAGSNQLFFDGIPIEELLPIEIRDNYCASCTDLLGKETHCRTVVYEGDEYEEVPARAIRHAALLALEREGGDGPEQDAAEQAENGTCGCSCNCSGGCDPDPGCCSSDPGCCR